MELEHAIGCNVKATNIAHFHPNGRDIVYGIGAQVVATDIADAHNQRFFAGHDNFVNCLAISHGGELIASGQEGPNADIILWDYQSGKLRFRFQEHDYGIQCVCFSHDDKLLVSAGFVSDKRLFVWNCETGMIQAWADLNPNPTICLAHGRYVKDIKRRETPLYQFAACGTQEINLWHCDDEEGSITANLVHAADKTRREWTTLVFSQDFEYLYAGTTTGDIACILLKNRVIQQFVSATNNISSISCMVNVTSSAEEYLIVGGKAGTVTVFRGETPQELIDTDQIRLDSGITSLALSPGHDEVLTITSFGSMYRVKTRKLAFTCAYQHPAGEVKSCSFPFGSSDQFLSTAADGNVTLWDLNDYSAKCICTERASPLPTCVAGSPDIIVAGYESGQIKGYEAVEGEPLWKIDSAHKNGVTALKLAKNLRFVVTGGMEGELRVWEIKTKEMISHLKEHVGKVNQLQLFTNDQYAISASRDRSILTWDLRAERRLTTHREKYGGINSLAVCGDQTTVFTVGQEKTITKWDLRQADAVGFFETGEEMLCMDLSHDDRYLATGGDAVHLWDTRCISNGALSVGKGHSRPVSCVAFAEDDKQLVSTSLDHSILVWNIYS